MFRHPVPDIPAILLGVALYVAVVGWAMLAPLAAFILLGPLGANTPEALPRHGLPTQLLAALLFFACGYITGRTANAHPVQNALVLGIVIYALVTLFNRVAWSLFGLSVPVDPAAEAGSLLRAVIATAVGGTAAQWQMVTRKSKQVRVATFPGRLKLGLFAFGIAPYAFIALSYRP